MPKLIKQNEGKHFGDYFIELDSGKLLTLFAPDWAIERIATFENVCNRPYPVWIENITEDGWYGDDLDKWVELNLDLSGIDFDTPLPKPVPSDDPLENILGEEIRKELDAKLITQLLKLEQ